MGREGHHRNFNSIKVQLKRDFRLKVFGFLEFQFHKGTIKTLVDARRNPTKQVFQFHKGTIKTLSANVRGRKRGNFNSIKVQLKLLIKLPMILIKTAISIP